LVQMAIAADSLLDPLRGRMVFRTDLTHRLNLAPSFIYLCVYKMAKDKEADWMKDISSETICTYYYWVFVITTIFVAIILIFQFSAIARNPKSATSILLSMPALILGVVNTLFIYIICSRALLK
jgi:hypothetical protein